MFLFIPHVSGFGCCLHHFWKTAPRVPDLQRGGKELIANQTVSRCSSNSKCSHCSNCLHLCSFCILSTVYLKKKKKTPHKLDILFCYVLAGGASEHISVYATWKTWSYCVYPGCLAKRLEWWDPNESGKVVSLLYLMLSVWSKCLRKHRVNGVLGWSVKDRVAGLNVCVCVGVGDTK